MGAGVGSVLQVQGLKLPPQPCGRRVGQNLFFLERGFEKTFFCVCVAHSETTEKILDNPPH